jgi:hypothetical protein
MMTDGGLTMEKEGRSDFDYVRGPHETLEGLKRSIELCKARRRHLRERSGLWLDRCKALGRPLSYMVLLCFGFLLVSHVVFDLTFLKKSVLGKLEMGTLGPVIGVLVFIATDFRLYDLLLKLFKAPKKERNDHCADKKD